MRKKPIKLLFFVVVAVILVIQVYPIFWLFMASLKDSTELAVSPFSLPEHPSLKNFVSVMQDGTLLRYMWNSVKVTVVSIVLIISLGSTMGYALSKFFFRINKKIYAFITAGIMIPVQITLIPLFSFYSKLGILNTTFSLVLPQVGFALPLSTMLFYSFYAFIPNELIEAAVMDGCSPARTFFSIILPQARNTVITVASMYTVFIWNDFIFANTFISDNKAKTIAVGLKDYIGAFGNVDWGRTYAAIALSVLPPIIVYFSLNKYVTAGMTMGATKG